MPNKIRSGKYCQECSCYYCPLATIEGYSNDDSEECARCINTKDECESCGGTGYEQITVIEYLKRLKNGR